MVVGLTPIASSMIGNSNLTVDLTAGDGTSIFQDQGQDTCSCLDHLVGVVCTRAFDTGPAQLDLIVTVLNGTQVLGTCPVHLAEHNYCGFDATYLPIQVDAAGNISCGTRMQFDVCPR
jgi:hypothetical protein